MPYASLRDFIARLEQSGRLVRVSEPVSPRAGDDRDPDPAAGRRRAGGAVRERHPRRRQRSPCPVLVNLFGTVKRVAWGMEPRAPHRAARGRRDAGLPAPARAARRLARGAGHAAAGQDRDGDEAADGRKRAPCQEVVLTGDDIDLGKLPIQTCWPGEPAPLITWPLVVTKGPSDSARGRLQPRHLPHAGDWARTAPSCAG